MRTALGKFCLGARGAAAIETALAVGVLITAFAGLMQTVNTVFVDDQAGSAARALNPDTNPWNPIWEELYSAENPAACTTSAGTCAKCTTCVKWTLAVRRDVSPPALAAALGPNPSASTVAGELVLVGLSRSSATANASPTTADVVKMDSVGVTRREPEA